MKLENLYLRFVLFQVLALCSNGIGAAPTTNSNGDVSYRGTFRTIRFLDNQKHGYMVTSDALYECDATTPSKWKATCSLIGKEVQQIAGGNSKTVFLVGGKVGPDQMVSLSRYSAAGGLTETRRIPRQACDFASDQIGAVAVGSSVEMTRDGGKTWAKLAAGPGSDMPGSEIDCLQWIGSDRLAVANGRFLFIYNLLPDGKVKLGWSFGSSVEMSSVVAVKDQLWFGHSPIIELDLQTGKKVAELEPKIPGGAMRMVAQGESIWIWSMTAASICSNLGEKVTEVPIRLPSLENVIPLGNEAAVLVTLDGKFYRLDKVSEKPQAMALEVDNTLIDAALATQAAADELGKPTPADMQAFNQAIKKVSDEGQREVYLAVRDKTFATPRDRVLFITKELQRYAENHATTQP